MFQIINTFKCNFKCDHCLQSASIHRNYMMTDQTFENAVSFGESYTDSVNLIGGEPFLHPDIQNQIDTLTYSFSSLSIVSNGSKLVGPKGLLKKGLEFVDNPGIWNHKSEISLLISDDIYHDEFKKVASKDIITYLENILCDRIVFEKDFSRQNDFIINLGRAHSNGLYCKSGNSLCPDITDGEFDLSVNPNGDVSICSNSRQIVGNVNYDSFEEVIERINKYSFKQYDSSECYKCKKYNPQYWAEFKTRYSKCI